MRKRPGRGGNCIKETTVQKYLETVSSLLEDAKKNDIIPFNPAHRVRKKHFEKEVQHIPQKYEIRKLMQTIRDEPILYRAYYTLAITTGLRRGELCALQWRDITGACELTVRRCRSCASGQIVESDTKSHRERIVTIPLGIWELLMALRQQQVLHSGVPDREQPIFTDPDAHVTHPDTFTRHLRKLYKKCGLPEEYHLHTLRHTFATMALEHGMDVKTLSTIIGHTSSATTLDIYSHVTDTMQKQAAVKIDRQIGKTDAPMPPDEQKQHTGQSGFQPYKSKYRKAGTGGIYQLNDHLWEGKYSPRDAHGKRISRNVYAKTREECEEKLAVMIEKVKREIAAEKEKLIARK